jgi:1,4-alpha-glucan branching enzyme
MESLNLIKNDPWLAPYEAAIEGRYQYVIDKEKSLTNNGKLTLSEMASGYLYTKPRKAGCSVNGRRMLTLFI